MHLATPLFTFGGFYSAIQWLWRQDHKTANFNSLPSFLALVLCIAQQYQFRHTTIIISKSLHINILSLWSINIVYIYTCTCTCKSGMLRYTCPLIRLTRSFQFQSPNPPFHHPRYMTSPYWCNAIYIVEYIHVSVFTHCTYMYTYLLKQWWIWGVKLPSYCVPPNELV